MADDTTTQDPQDTTTDQPTDADEPQKPDTGDTAAKNPEVEKWKALARKHEDSAKTNAEAAKRLKAIEDSAKSETEKLTEKAATAEERAITAEGRADRLEVVLAKLPEDATAADVKRLVVLSKRLVGNTREELEADADELLSTFQTTPAASGRPSGDIGQGARNPTKQPAGSLGEAIANRMSSKP